MGMAVHLAIAGDVFDGVLFLCCHFSHEMSWMRYGAELGEFVNYTTHLCCLLYMCIFFAFAVLSG